MERDISVRPTEMTRPVTVDHLQSWSRIFPSDQTEKVRSISWTNRNFRNFGLNGKRPKTLILSLVFDTAVPTCSPFTKERYSKSQVIPTFPYFSMVWHIIFKSKSCLPFQVFFRQLSQVTWKHILLTLEIKPEQNDKEQSRKYNLSSSCTSRVTDLDKEWCNNVNNELASSLSLLSPRLF